MTWWPLPAKARRPCRRSLRISESCLNGWPALKSAQLGVIASEPAEQRDLRRRNKLLEQENEVLRRAAAFFAREISQKDVPAGP